MLCPFFLLIRSLAFSILPRQNSLQLEPGRYRNTWAALRANVQSSGPLVLYRGLPSWLLFSFPRNAVRFYVFEGVSSSTPLSALPDLARNATAGGIAGVLEGVTCLVPMQNISIKMTHGKSGY